MREWDYRACGWAGGVRVGFVEAEDAEGACAAARSLNPNAASVEVTPRGATFAGEFASFDVGLGVAYPETIRMRPIKRGPVAPRRFGSVALPAEIVRAALVLVAAAQDEAQAALVAKANRALEPLGIKGDLSAAYYFEAEAEAGRARARAEDGLAVEIEAALSARLVVEAEPVKAGELLEVRKAVGP